MSSTATDAAVDAAAFERLFPGAPEPRPLRLRRPPIGVLVARRWNAVGSTLALIGLYLLGMLQLLAPGGTVLGYGVGWFVISLTVFVIGVIVWLGAAARVRRTRALEPTAWERWAAERGFRRLGARQQSGLTITPSRDYGSLYAGRAGSTDIIIGNCYVHAPTGIERNAGLGLVAALVHLPATAADRFPASRLDRFLVGRHPIRRSHHRDLRELRLDSIALDDSCELRVAAGSSDLDWYLLLQPSIVDGLSRDWPVSWIQHGDRLVVFAPAPIGTLDGAQVDAICAGAHHLATAFVDAARTARPIQPEEASDARRRAASHRLRRRIIDVLVVAACIALVVIPIVVTVTLDHRSDRAEVASIEREQERFVARYAANETASVVYECVTSAVGSDCVHAPDRQRARITASTVVSDARLDQIAVRRVDDALEVTARSGDGVAYRVLVPLDAEPVDPIDVYDAVRALERTCSPRGPGCKDGTWSDG